MSQYVFVPYISQQSKISPYGSRIILWEERLDDPQSFERFAAALNDQVRTAVTILHWRRLEDPQPRP
jgi:hypothetical protein